MADMVMAERNGCITCVECQWSCNLAVVGWRWYGSRPETCLGQGGWATITQQKFIDGTFHPSHYPAQVECQSEHIQCKWRVYESMYNAGGVIMREYTLQVEQWSAYVQCQWSYNEILQIACAVPVKIYAMQVER